MSLRSNAEGFICPVCGYPGLTEPAYDQYGCSSFEICPSCGIEFAYEDVGFSHRDLRYRWITDGAKWHSTADAPPPEWSPEEQLDAAGMDAAASARYYEMPNEPPPTFDEVLAALKDWLRQWAPGIDAYRLKFFEEKDLRVIDGNGALPADALRDFESLREFFERLQQERRAWIELRGYGRAGADEYWIGIAHARAERCRRTDIGFPGPPSGANGEPREWVDIEPI